MRQGRGAKSPPLLPDAEGLVPTAFLSAPGRGAFPSAIKPNTIGGRRASVCPMFGKTYESRARRSPIFFAGAAADVCFFFSGPGGLRPSGNFFAAVWGAGSSGKEEDPGIFIKNIR